MARDEGVWKWVETGGSLEYLVKEAGFHLEGNMEPLMRLGGANTILHFISQSLVDGGETRLEAGRPARRLL